LLAFAKTAPVFFTGDSSMVQSTLKPLSFEQFLELYPEDGRYELINGEIVRILSTRQHDKVAEFISDALKQEVRRMKLNYWVSGRIVVCTLTQNGKEQGRHPDVSMVELAIWDANPTAYSALREPLQIAVEVVSTNWEDDYIDEVTAAPGGCLRENGDKLDEYQRQGIHEYWIVDYLAIGPRQSIGSPKLPTITVYQLVEGSYQQVGQLRGSDRIVSPTLPELALTAEQVMTAY